MSCSFRNHYKNFKKNIITLNSLSVDQELELNEKGYDRIIIQYDEELEKLTQRIFEEKYISSMVIEQEN
jgi:hypothetical protein